MSTYKTNIRTIDITDNTVFISNNKNKVYRVATRIKGSNELLKLVCDSDAGPRIFNTWKEANEYAKQCREENQNDSTREKRSFVVLNFDK